MRRLFLILPLLMLALAGMGQVIKNPPPKGEPVVVRNDTLFQFYTGQGLFSAKERADIVTNRLNTIMSHLDFSIDSLKLQNDSAVSVIYYKSHILLAVSDKDASYSELDRKQLAAQYLGILRTRLRSLFETNNVKDLLINVGEAIAVIIVLFFLIWGINRSFRLIKFKTLRAWENRMRKLAEKGAPVRYAHRFLPFISRALTVARLLIIVLLVYLALPVLFLIFPWTKPISNELLGYVVNPLKATLLSIVHYIPNLLTIVVIFAITFYILKLVKFFADELGKGSFTIKNFYPEWASPTYNIIRVLLYAFMFIVIFPYLPGSESKVFQGVTVFVGVLFSFGSSSAIANMVAGIVLTYNRAFKIGDRIQAGNVIG
ncbi:MAG TPA: mechanosensitive ion channel domain-containing protein, partial [Mucilaginibacter sp.]|nr:mechanosensitive ion channel domain-containing protein [Mucilaginibacter sp.]